MGEVKEEPRLWDKIVTLARQGKTAREIRQLTNCSKAYAYKAVKFVEQEKQKAKVAPSKVEVETVEAPVIEVEPAPTPTEKKPPQVVLHALEGELSAEDMTYVWESINELFPEQYQRPEKAMRLLGKVWVKPVNRYIKDIAMENADLYIAIVVTLITFAPSIKGALQEALKGRRKPPIGKGKGESEGKSQRTT